MEKVVDALYGYDGWVGICVGHPSLIHDAKALPPANTGNEKSNTTDDSSEGTDKYSSVELLGKMKELAKDDPNGKVSFKDIMALLEQVKNIKPSEVTVVTGGSSVSSISHVASPSVQSVSTQMLVLTNAIFLLT